MSPDDTLVRDVILRDGTTLWLRPPTGADEAAVLAFFARLSPVSVYRRFHGVPRITPRLIAPFLDPDWHETGALVGTLAGEGPGHAYAGQIVALASYVRLRAASSVEAAFAVAEVLPDNRAMIDVFADAGFRGKPPADADALADLLLRLSRLAADLPELTELDLIPIVAGPDGCVAVDWRIRVQPLSAARRTKAW